MQNFNMTRQCGFTYAKLNMQYGNMPFLVLDKTYCFDMIPTEKSTYTSVFYMYYWDKAGVCQRDEVWSTDTRKGAKEKLDIAHNFLSNPMAYYKHLFLDVYPDFHSEELYWHILRHMAMEKLPIDMLQRVATRYRFHLNTYPARDLGCGDVVKHIGRFCYEKEPGNPKMFNRVTCDVRLVPKVCSLLGYLQINMEEVVLLLLDRLSEMATYKRYNVPIGCLRLQRADVDVTKLDVARFQFGLVK